MTVRNPAFGPQASAQSQYNTLSAQMQGMTPDSPFYRDLRTQRDALVPQMQQQGAGTGAAANTGSSMGQSRQQILDYTAGRGDAVMNDAMTNAALTRLQGVATGTDAPFTQSVQNQMLAKQAGMNASSEASQAQQLRQQAAGVGGSIADPSYQAKLRELASQTQASNLSAQGQIGTTAQLQNFGARQTANNSLMSGRMGQLGMANSQYNQAAGFLQNDSQNGPHQSAVTTPPIYNFYGQGSSQMPYTAPGVQPFPGTGAKPAAAPAVPSGSVINAAGGVGNQPYGPPIPGSVINAAGGVGSNPYGPPIPDLYNFGGFNPNLPVY